jgi:hypothetical protein
MKIDKNTKILIIPDVHTHFERAEAIIKKNKVDYIIFLGDYFDEFDDNGDIALATAEWLKYSLNQENRVHITGNHDIMYHFSQNRMIRCSGYDSFKSDKINCVLKEQDWAKLRYFVTLPGNWLLTHAGIHPSHLRSRDMSFDEITEFLKEESITCDEVSKNGGNHWFNHSGMCRGGGSAFGGLLWLDFDREFEPLPNVNQLVGHTPSSKWREIRTISTNYCIDTHPKMMYYAIYQNEKIDIIENKI